MLKVKLPYLDNATITNQRDCNPEYEKSVKCQIQARKSRCLSCNMNLIPVSLLHILHM